MIQTFDDPDEWPSIQSGRIIAALTNLNDQKEKGVPVIAILDSGIDVAHPALELQVYRSEEAVNKLCRDDYTAATQTMQQGLFRRWLSLSSWYR